MSNTAAGRCGQNFKRMQVHLADGRGRNPKPVQVNSAAGHGRKLKLKTVPVQPAGRHGRNPKPVAVQTPGRRSRNPKQALLQPAGITGGTLRFVARGMLPFYKAIAESRLFARQWSRAVAAADLDRMHELLFLAAPFAAKQGFGTNGIGYFIAFELPVSGGYYSNGTTIIPGTAQFVFQPAVHRQMARSLLPFYRELVCNKPYAAAVAKAICRKDRKALEFMVRSLVKSGGLKSVSLEKDGLGLLFKYKSSPYYYRNLLFREYD